MSDGMAQGERRLSTSVVDSLAERGYEVVRPLDDPGGMGEVWVVRHKDLNEERCLKLIRPELLREDSSRVFALFDREHRVADALGRRHDHIIKVHEYGQLIDATPFSILPFYPAGSLETMGEGPRSRAGVAALASVLHDIADALCFLASHQDPRSGRTASYVHRDVKPANILVDEPGGSSLPRGVLSDFGLARAVDDLSLSAYPSGAGTAAWKAPEVWLGHQPEPPADVYAFALTVQHTLIGRPAFQARTLKEWAHAHVARQPALYRPRAQQLQDVADLIEFSLHKDPDHRPSAIDWRAALDQAVATYRS